MAETPAAAEPAAAQPPAAQPPAAQSVAAPAAAAPASSPLVALKKGALVRLNLKAYASSLEAAASVSAAPA